VVGDGYKIIQNAEVLNRALAIVGADGQAVVDTCGVLGHGERFFAYVDLGTIAIDPAGINDRVTRGLGVLTSHDGTAAITYAMSNIRWVCQNTVTAGLNSAARVFRARHTTNVAAALADAHKVLGISESWEKSFSSLANRLLQVNDGGSSGRAHDILGRVERSLWPLADEPTNHALTIAEGRSTELHKLLDSKTCGGNFGYNGWSVYNAFVEYSDHLRPRLSEDRRAEAVVLGTTDDWKDRVAGLVLA
jgi:phage/plasmid-like protein (TIGR03299 family)